MVYGRIVEMTTPKDIIGRKLASLMLHRLHIADDGEADTFAKEVLRSLERAGFAIIRQSVAPVAATRCIPVAAARRIDPNDQKQRPIEEIEATTAQRTEDWIRDMQAARGWLRR